MLRLCGPVISAVIFHASLFRSRQNDVVPNHAEVAVATGAQPTTRPARNPYHDAKLAEFQAVHADGMVALFEGKYFWKMPADVSMEVGPTVNYPLPKELSRATEKYSSQVKIVELPDGGLTLTGFKVGLFPNPEEPHKGWKVLATFGTLYAAPDRGYPRLHLRRQLDGLPRTASSINSCCANSPTTPIRDAAGDRQKSLFFTNWFMLLVPEQQKYTTALTIDYADPARSEDSYVFVPHCAVISRCHPWRDVPRPRAPTPIHDDYQFGFDSNITQLKVDYVAQRKLLTMERSNLPQENFPAGFDLPLGWPQPSMGKWQVRDVDEISVSTLPSHGGASCYGKRVLYVDSHFYTPLWVENFDKQMKPQRCTRFFFHIRRGARHRTGQRKRLRCGDFLGPRATPFDLHGRADGEWQALHQRTGPQRVRRRFRYSTPPA